MIKTLKQTIKNLYYWIKQKLIRFKNWIILIIFGAVILAAPPQPLDISLEKIQDKYEASDIKDKHRLEKTAFILDAVDENAIQAEVGNKTLDNFTPELTLRKWDDEVNFKVKYKHTEKEKDQKVDIENEKIKWKGNKTEVHYYDIKKGELLHDKVLESDVFEVEVILLEKPDTNIVSFDIETKGLAFYYQPELTQEEIDEGAFRPENVIGSYAVYHESKQGDYSPMGLKNYRAGKAFHIYRPKIIDSAGTEVWGELNITDNLLTVTIPQEFLDNAVYPVRHAAGLTFGYESIGGSLWDVGYNNLIGSSFANTAGSGDGDKITVHINNAKDLTFNIKSALYVYTGIGNAGNLIQETNEVGFSADENDWIDFSFVSAPSIVDETTYFLVLWCSLRGDANNDINASWDSVADAGFYDNLAYGSFPSPITTENANSAKYSIYCTYTAEEEEARRMFLTQ